jgi:hypothetical protein
MGSVERAACRAGCGVPGTVKGAGCRVPGGCGVPARRVGKEAHFGGCMAGDGGYVAPVTVPQRAQVQRLLRALLACLAVAMVVTPAVGVAAWREATVVIAGAVAGDPGHVQLAASSGAWSFERPCTFRVDRLRPRLDYEPPRRAVDVRLLTRVVLC